jgi:riboflavin biosynthesis pyrimidine reductase
MALPRIEFPVDKIKLTKIYEAIEDEKNYSPSSLETNRTREIYGKFLLPSDLAERPLLFGCFVSSIDGVLAFKDNPSSTVIARKNKFDLVGAKADLWLLNFYRAHCDGVIMGPKTLQAEPKVMGHIYDQKLEGTRQNLLSKPAVPVNIIISGTGKSIPYGHLLFSTPEVPVLVVTSPKGADRVEANMQAAYTRVDVTADYSPKVIREVNKELTFKQAVILACGQEQEVNDELLVRFLKECGLDKILVETPSYAHHLIQQELLDELFLHQSGIYIGGGKGFNGDLEQAFASANPPKTKMLSIHNHSPHFFYYRYQLIYN